MTGIVLVLFVVLVASSGCRSGPDSRAGERPPQAEGTAPTVGRFSAEPQTEGEWVMAPGDYANTRFSTLAEINASNVSQLQEAWSFSTGTLGGHDAAPLVVGSTMYVVTPFPGVRQPIDGVGHLADRHHARPHDRRADRPGARVSQGATR